jgi:hypothetical protein
MLIASFLSMAVSGVLCGPDGPTITRYRAEAGQEFPCPVHPEVLHEAATKQRQGRLESATYIRLAIPKDFPLDQKRVGIRSIDVVVGETISAGTRSTERSFYIATRTSRKLNRARGCVMSARTPGKTVMHSSRENQPTFGKTTGLVYSSRQAPDGEIDALQICSFSRD